MASTSPERKRVCFAETASVHSDEDDEGSSDDESFREITTSEGESFCSSDEEDATRLELLYQSVPPSVEARLDPVERSSLLWLDKDLLDSEELESQG